MPFLTRFTLYKIFEGSSKFVYRNFVERTKFLCLILLNPRRWNGHESYFPDKKRKSDLKIFLDQLMQIIKYGSPNTFYFPYGFDVKTKAEMNEYLHYTPFSSRRDSLNFNSMHSTTAVLRDKLLFGMFTSYNGVNSGDIMGISGDERIFNLRTKSFQTIEDFLGGLDASESDLFLKPIDGQCGHGIYHVIVSGGKMIANGKEMSMGEIKKILSSSSYLIQRTITQHPKMASLHPQSLNTIRLVTIRNNATGQYEVFPSILRIGCGDSIVDNTSQGGLAVGVDIASGRLKEFGFYKPEYGTKVSVHPDSDIRFSDFVIPHFEECKRQALFLHSQLRGIHSIGWDIAVGENGPVFVEGNDNWEINGPQICNGGLKKAFLNACGEK